MAKHNAVDNEVWHLRESRTTGNNDFTGTVKAVVSNNVGLRDAAVYGVHVPGLEGSPSMAALADEDDSVDVEIITAALHKSLPAHARPVFFLRLLQRMDSTAEEDRAKKRKL
ncbi:hypothetical protein ACOMHN_004410 [Nucella lapillus]